MRRVERAAEVRHPEAFRDIYHRVYREPPYGEDAAAADAFAEREKPDTRHCPASP
ncbi:hypothetical protein ACIO8F_16475 [Streptomyces sp. NPDC087228]|uniref:hypothetical protein n=1 Tax=unclassified Streptomyces TaxID=2593676 RepID=UPI0038170999